jgi:acetyl-CoA C-acetyltransferase
MLDMTTECVILGYARTPYGKLGGGLSSLSAVQLGTHAVLAALERAGVAPHQVQHVVMGHVLQAGAGQNPARQVVVRAGMPVEVTAETINKVCASGLRAVSLASLLIRSGQHDVVVAGGMESMSQAPYLAPGARDGFRMGHVQLLDAMIHDGLTDPFDGKHMVVHNSEVSAEVGITREQQDAWAARSQQRTIAARDVLAEEIAPVTISGRKGDIVVDTDEAPREGITAEMLAQLKPVFTKDGTTTAGNAPGVNDGAGALVLASADWANEHGIAPLARVGATAYVADESPYLCRTPGNAINLLLQREGLSSDDLDLVEINEAFATVAINSTRMVGVSDDIVNVNGGAIALGHPIGASGVRLVGTLAMELRRRGGSRGVAALCSGGGQGDALLVEAVS